MVDGEIPGWMDNRHRDGVLVYPISLDPAGCHGQDGRSILVVGIRLFCQHCQSIHHDTVKLVRPIGTSDGHPSSSHSFVDYKADVHFYLNPHHSRATISSSDPANLQLRPPGDST
ncbi:hypothetical protein EDB85DRAFT_212726 [Lactarius pseudohatsudake]|nr:hypothetical protein EDB85DRAFT_212726 [Lactarius pseudohatsudake]